MGSTSWTQWDGLDWLGGMVARWDQQNEVGDMGWDGLDELSSVCFDRGKDAQGGSDGMGIEVVERLR